MSEISGVLIWRLGWTNSSACLNCTGTKWKGGWKAIATLTRSSKPEKQKKRSCENGSQRGNHPETSEFLTEGFGLRPAFGHLLSGYQLNHENHRANHRQNASPNFRAAKPDAIAAMKTVAP